MIARNEHNSDDGSLQILGSTAPTKANAFHGNLQWVHCAVQCPLNKDVSKSLSDCGYCSMQQSRMAHLIKTVAVNFKLILAV